MTSAPLSAGEYISARCSKCKEITNHTIVALIEEVPVKVQCNTCNSEHKYRKPAAPKKASTRVGTRKTKVDPKAAERQQWQELQGSFENKQTQAYSMDANFKVNSLVKHPTFGVGKVQAITGARKMDVLFEDGIKVLRCG